MGRQFLKYSDKEIEKQQVHPSKKTVAIGHVNIKKIVSGAFVYSKNKKTGLAYRDSEKIRPFFISLLHMIGHANSSKKAKYMNFIIKSEELLKKYKVIWNKVSNIMGPKSDSHPMYEEKYLRARKKIYNGEMNADF